MEGRGSPSAPTPGDGARGDDTEAPVRPRVSRQASSQGGALVMRWQDMTLTRRAFKRLRHEDPAIKSPDTLSRIISTTTASLASPNSDDDDASLPSRPVSDEDEDIGGSSAGATARADGADRGGGGGGGGAPAD